MKWCYLFLHLRIEYFQELRELLLVLLSKPLVAVQDLNVLRDVLEEVVEHVHRRVQERQPQFVLHQFLLGFLLLCEVLLCFLLLQLRQLIQLVRFLE